MKEHDGARPGIATLMVMLAVVVSGCAPIATGASPTDGVSSAPQEASEAAPPAKPEQPLPVPDGETVLAVLAPEVVEPKVTAEEAIALVGASMGDMAWEPPRVQLVRLAFRDPYSAFGPVWTGWIILSTDLPGSLFGGPYLPDLSPRPTISIVVTYTWFYVSPDGELMGETQVGYVTPGQVPSIPPEEPAGG
ncbi:MAG TPA: hypothetical protein VEW45_05220 [Candidatus Dormibacteraeota bacterium]|nr:hypothetical protein [Candidatus Dormibacteraeota bacterium]